MLACSFLAGTVSFSSPFPRCLPFLCIIFEAAIISRRVIKMPFDTKDTEVYRRNEKAGGRLLSPEERIKLLEVRLLPMTFGSNGS